MAKSGSKGKKSKSKKTKKARRVESDLTPERDSLKTDASSDPLEEHETAGFEAKPDDDRQPANVEKGTDDGQVSSNDKANPATPARAVTRAERREKDAAEGLPDTVEYAGSGGAIVFLAVVFGLLVVAVIVAIATR